MLPPAATGEPGTCGKVPRVVHLGYFDAILYGVLGGLTFDELRRRLVAISHDLARYHGRRLPAERANQSVLWTTTRDAVGGLMRCELVEPQPLPARRGALSQHADRTYSLSRQGRELLGQPSVGRQRDVLAAALYAAHPYFRRYLQQLQRVPLFVPELAETELDRFQFRAGWGELAREVAERAAHSPAGAAYHPGEIADALDEFVARRFEPREGRATARRKAVLDAVRDGITGFVSRAEGIGADATSLRVLHAWGRQLFLTGSSRYVADAPAGLLHWSASAVDELDGRVRFRRRALPEAAEEAVWGIGTAYHRLLRPGTRLVEYFRLRGTAGFYAGVSNDLVDRVVAAMIAGRLPNPFGLQPSRGAQWTPPPSERPLRIGARRYTLVGFSRDAMEQ